MNLEYFKRNKKYKKENKRKKKNKHDHSKSDIKPDPPMSACRRVGHTARSKQGIALRFGRYLSTYV